jgi:hypothetical protein
MQSKILFSFNLKQQKKDYNTEYCLQVSVSKALVILLIISGR